MKELLILIKLLVIKKFLRRMGIDIRSKPKSLLLTTRIGYSKPVVMTGSLNF
jgi:PP-loop superfamily ATP-utilizing enzyme